MRHTSPVTHRVARSYAWHAPRAARRAAVEPSYLPTEGANNVGYAGAPIGRDVFWAEGGTASNALNAIPGVNAVAGFHDLVQVRLDDLGSGVRGGVLNYAGMVPSAIITYGALIESRARNTYLP